MRSSHLGKWQAGKWMMLLGCTAASPTFAADDSHFSTVIERAQQLIATLEERHRLVKILNACLEGVDLQIIIGSEVQIPDLEGISLIGARYTNGSQELGAIGIMGPTRMEYARHISVVHYIACSLSAAITEAGGSELHN